VAKGPKKLTGDQPAGDEDAGGARSRISQSDVPSYSLEQALRVPKAIAENYAFKPTKPLNVAVAMNMTPYSGQFRGRCGAAIAYGLTSGGYNAPEIKIEPLGLRIVRPLEDGDDVRAMREALLNPRVFGEFLRKYDGSPLPREEIARNVLLDMGVPQDRTADVLQLLLESAEAVGFLRQIKDKRYIDLDGVEPSAPRAEVDPLDEDIDESDTDEVHEIRSFPPAKPSAAGQSLKAAHPIEDIRIERETNARRVFVTHGKNKFFHRADQEAACVWRA